MTRSIGTFMIFLRLASSEETELNGEMKFVIIAAWNWKIQLTIIILLCTVVAKTKELHICPMDFFQEQLPGCSIEGPSVLKF